MGLALRWSDGVEREADAPRTIIVDSAAGRPMRVRFVEAGGRQTVLDVTRMVLLASPADEPTAPVMLDRGPEPFLWLTERDGQVRLPVSRILRIEAAKDYALIHVAGRCHILRTTMAELEARLDPSAVMRVHRSAFVRLSAVRRIGWTGRARMRLYMEDGAGVDVGPTYTQRVARALGAKGP